MAVCKNIKSFSRHHERLADLFSLLALTLLFGSIWATLRYHQAVTLWLQDNWVLHSALLVAALVADVFLILAFLAIGSARFGAEDERCFGTFRGRRNGGSPIDAVRNWVLHMEHVGKRHR
jgi:hypothetical protein